MSFVKYNDRTLLTGWPADIATGLVVGGLFVAPWALGWLTMIMSIPRVIEKIGGLFG